MEEILLAGLGYDIIKVFLPIEGEKMGTKKSNCLSQSRQGPQRRRNTGFWSQVLGFPTAALFTSMTNAPGRPKLTA